MARIVSAMAMVHNPMITGRRDAARPEQAHHVWQGFEALRQDLEAASPDWMLVITNEHFVNFFFNNMPPMLLGMAPRFQSIPEPSAGLQAREVPSDESVARQLLDSAWGAGFDLAYSQDMRLDHGTMVPLHFLTPRFDLPVVHVHQLTNSAPRPALRRCYELGAMLRDFIAARPASERVAVMGTGGLSHWVGSPMTGQVNAAWDQHVLRLLEGRRDEELLAMTKADIDVAGDGAHEIRNWITVAGVVPGAPAEVVSYEAHIPEWIMGSAHVRFRLDAAQ